MPYEFPDDHSSQPPVLDGKADPAVAKVGVRLAALAFPMARPLIPLVDLLLPGKGEETIVNLLGNLFQKSSLSGVAWLITAAAMAFGLDQATANELATKVAPGLVAAIGVAKVVMK